VRAPSPEQCEFFQGLAPAAKIPGYQLGGISAEALLQLEFGSPEFEFDAAFRKFRYAFDQEEPPKNLVWMLLPILERLHGERSNFTVHATAFARDGKGVIAVGETHSGKTSTLLHAMLARGFSGIAGEHALISESSILAGTKTVEFFSGLVARLPALHQHLGVAGIGWEKRHRIQIPMIELGPTLESCPLAMVLFPMVTSEDRLQTIIWTKRKMEIELYKKLSEMIRAFNSFLFNNAVGFPPLDDMALSACRMACAMNIVRSRPLLILKGRADQIVDEIDKTLDRC
jgi:hypothetical protein